MGNYMWRESQLLTYEQLVTMANSEWTPRPNTVAELNLYPSEYFNELDWWNHLTTYSWVTYIVWITHTSWRNTDVIQYSGNSWSKTMVRLSW